MKILKGLAASVLLFFLVFIYSCSEDEAPKVVLTEATSILKRSSGELKTFINASSLNMDASALKYDVEIFRVKYKTIYKNTEVIASGLVILPTTSEAVGMVSFQHGTIVADSDAPSTLSINNTQLIFFAAIASPGFIGVIPDFIGFGESKEIFHPYYVEEATAAAVIDNLKAARDLAKQKGIKFNNKLFLAGYSQGGYATMAAHKSLETNGMQGFNLIASFPASGGYDVKGVQGYFFGQQVYDQPHYLAYVAMSYQSYYDWTEPLSNFFREPYASRIPGLFNGTNGASNINAQLTSNVSELVQPDLLQHIDTDAKYNYLVEAFNENSLLDWKPTIKMYMYHGDADTTVPYQNSVSTYNHFISQGASTNVVKFKTLPGADHASGVIPYLEDFINVVLELK